MRFRSYGFLRLDASFARVALTLLLLAQGALGLSSQEAVPGNAAPPPDSALSADPLELLDAPVTRTDYLLGTGDVLTLSVIGAANLLHTLSVSPDGTIVIPSIGLVCVSGLNVEEAEARVRDAVLRLYRNVAVDLTLTRTRRFRVFVVGDVPAPGLRVASPATRVSEVVPQLGARVHRNVLVQRTSGDTVEVDLIRFRQLGDLTANPTLREGDAVVVRAIDQTVDVFGRVHFPGQYEYREGETLAEFLSIVNGARPFPSNAADTVRVTRFVDKDRREFYAFSRDEALGATGQAFILEPFDALYIAAISNYKLQKTATIQGEVLRPGTYPIVPDSTTVRDLVTLAGGFTEDASLVNATLRRRTQNLRGEGLEELQNVPPEFLSPEDRRILQVRARGDESNVVVEFEDLYSRGEDAFAQTLEAGDVLTVPARTEGVTVLGAVMEPGIIQYVPGKTIDYFIARAGSYSERADRGDVVVLKAKLGNRTDPKDARWIGPGDQIIVPFEEPRTFLQRIAAANAVVSTISGFLLTLLALDRLYDTVTN